MAVLIWSFLSSKPLMFSFYFSYQLCTLGFWVHLVFLNLSLESNMNWTCICAIPSPGPGPVRALKEVIICILPETYTFVSGFSLLLSAVCVCFSALHHCPWVAVLSCCSNVLAAL